MAIEARLHHGVQNWLHLSAMAATPTESANGRSQMLPGTHLVRGEALISEPTKYGAKWHMIMQTVSLDCSSRPYQIKLRFNRFISHRIIFKYIDEFQDGNLVIYEVFNF